jgi:hypothetical protein
VAVDIGAIRTAQIIDTHVRRVKRQLAMTAGNAKVLCVAAKANVASGAAAKGHAAGAAKAIPIPFVRSGQNRETNRCSHDESPIAKDTNLRMATTNECSYEKWQILCRVRAAVIYAVTRAHRALIALLDVSEQVHRVCGLGSVQDNDSLAKCSKRGLFCVTKGESPLDGNELALVRR